MNKPPLPIKSAQWATSRSKMYFCKGGHRGHPAAERPMKKVPWDLDDSEWKFAVERAVSLALLARKTKFIHCKVSVQNLSVKQAWSLTSASRSSTIDVFTRRSVRGSKFRHVH